jgi:hypothetical protein
MSGRLFSSFVVMPKNTALLVATNAFEYTRCRASSTNEARRERYSWIRSNLLTPPTIIPTLCRIAPAALRRIRLMINRISHALSFPAHRPLLAPAPAHGPP